MAAPASTVDLIESAREGDRRALARLITAAEDGTDEGFQALATLYPAGRRAWTTGVTGAPGAGKSTLVDGMVAELRAGEQRVAVVAVDPSSPFTGGAVLGDRIRMQRHTADEGVFIRSMANRGSLGGIAESTPRAVAVLTGVGYDEVVVETVGVGQAEVDVASAVDTTVVVVNPGWGDAVQAAKAGLLEIADIFVVNKADAPGTDATVRDLVAMLDVAEHTDPPPVLTAIATTGEGVAALVGAVADHRRRLAESGRLQERRRRQAAAALESAVATLLRRRRAAGSSDEGLLERIAGGEIDPWTAARSILDGDSR